MKTLYLVRHGKSDWDKIDINDIDRPLKERGMTQTEEIGIKLQETGEIPDILISSPAVRAFETAKILFEQLKIDSRMFKVDEKLYLPDFPTLLKIVLYLNNDLKSVMLVGHEPSLSNCINYFINNPLDKVVTASMTKLVFDVKDWRDISPSNFKSGIHLSRHNLDGITLH